MNSPQLPPSEEVSDGQELLEWRDLQNAQMSVMAHVWDNPEDDCWNDLPGVESPSADSGHPNLPR